MMDETEQWIADEVRLAVNEYSNSTERAEQDKNFIIGPSAIGFCSERLRRQLDRQEPEDEVEWNKAFIGTWLGEGLEQAIQKRWPKAITQAELIITLEGDERSYTVPGHSDLIVPLDKLVLDFKAVDGLEFVRFKEVADQGYRFQRHLYGLGAWQMGMFGECPLEEVRVGNVYYDRSGREATPHVEIENFDMDILRQITWWLDEVVLAFLNGEEATKEPPREMCAKTCGFFEKCRGFDTDVEGVIRDVDQLTAIEMYLAAGEMERQAKRMKNEATLRLKDVTGNTATHTLRWTLVNGGVVSYNREPYMRISLTKKRK